MRLPSPASRHERIIETILRATDMDRAITEWLDGFDESGHEALGFAPKAKLTYTIYGCLLLLASNSFEKHPWRDLYRRHTDQDFQRLYQLVAKHLKVTHIAINKPIPATNFNNGEENVLRAPNNFTPLCGNFGPSKCSSPPTAEDYVAAFWVTAKQNGIYQTWAPRWTMFSRGNISEKARLLTLPSVKEAVEQGKADERGSAAVDLYAGIGYFAFSYLKAGVDQVLCWDLNPWSTEGLKRGARANKWTFFEGSENTTCLDDIGKMETRLIVFNESNEFTSDRINQLRRRLPPVRHVNCGLLPTSRDSWRIALGVLDSDMGGWIHVHSNFAVDEIELKSEELRSDFQFALESNEGRKSVEIEDVYRVKSYGPGVMHCVVDLHVSGWLPDRNAKNVYLRSSMQLMMSFFVRDSHRE